MSHHRVAVFVWSRNIRLFHWLNVITITLLLAVGIVIFNAKILEISTSGKILLKTIHVYIGYVFAFNLLFRIVLGFVGKNFERWSRTLPFTQGFSNDLTEYKKNRSTVYQGHNPLGKLMVALLFSLMMVQMISGLVLAGTDIYYPPFGQYVVHNIAIDKDNLAAIKPYSKENVDEPAYQSMRALRKPFITAHEYTFYLFLLLIPLHLLGVLVAERSTRSSLVSAMINGFKYLPVEKDK